MFLIINTVLMTKTKKVHVSPLHSVLNVFLAKASSSFCTLGSIFRFQIELFFLHISAISFEFGNALTLSHTRTRTHNLPPMEAHTHTHTHTLIRALFLSFSLPFSQYFTDKEAEVQEILNSPKRRKNTENFSGVRTSFNLVHH